jgi:hypothetical protein
MLDDENLFFYPYFHATHTHPTAKFLKLYVREVNSIHFMQNGDENRVEIRGDKFIIFVLKRILWHHLRHLTRHLCLFSGSVRKN